jgi:hypothetical protein
VALDAIGNLYIVDSRNQRIRKISVEGVITTVAGNGSKGSDNVPAANAKFGPLWNGVTVDASGNLYIGEGWRVRKVSTKGIITTVAGNGSMGSYGDGGPATSAQLWGTAGVAVGADGNLYIADPHENRIRKVSADGMITTVAGDGLKGYSGDGGPPARGCTNHTTWRWTPAAICTLGMQATTASARYP